MNRISKKIQKFINLESSGGFFLLISAIIAMLWANTSPSTYNSFIHAKISMNIFGFVLDMTTESAVNDGLMSIFFLVVGIELRSEIKEGSLSSIRNVSFPAIMAICGFVAPAVIYLTVTGFNPASIKGWAIPTATDIAFAMGALMIFGSRVPAGLKLALLALAIIDDLLAIITIAIFYTSDINTHYLLLSASVLIAMLIISKILKVRATGVYMIMGVLLWAFTLKSGIHATLAGIALAFILPYKGVDKDPRSPAKIVEQSCHSYVSFLIVPLFTICNAGIYILDIGFKDITNPVTIGVGFGLLLGKVIGISGSAFLMNKFNVVKFPKNVTFPMIVGMSFLGAIGFTMALFVGALSGQNPVYYKAGIVCASILAALLGYIALDKSLPKKQ
ncbi:Na+/H+ antiporter NhaA [Photobacterium kishitanii]|uniref:Na(+)/H(+) antiporter NhaA n=1 Tax=Photobacterium kishitanii TaxID=318456 RepID=A0A2T3KM22_9GAMM|nr:Na+/H+ antiporter NhaA [Photobacterium kishitanii]PSV00745.1 Na+/H+ antiporter NhaA [Photobacterium kishitanii]